MTRLIDADALKNSIDEHVYLVHHGFNETEYGCTQYGIHQIIDNAPTIEALPVRHGKWVGYAGTIGNECSMCGKWIDVLQGTAEMNYCPNCGARMDKE